MSAEQSVNIPLLRKAVEWAEAEAMKPPELCEWEQVDTVVTAEHLAFYDRAPECGTCYCIAGYVAAVETGLENPYDSPEVSTVVDFAAARLGLSEGGPGWDLFAMFNSIEDVRRIAEEIAGERL